SDLLGRTEQLEKYLGEKNVLTERLKHYEENKVKLDHEIESIYRHKSYIMAEVERENNQLTSLEKEREGLNKQIKEVTSKLFNERDDLLAKIEHLKSDYIEGLNERAVTKNERQNIKRNIAR